MEGSESLVNHRTEIARNLATEVRSLFSYSHRNCTRSAVTVFDASSFSYNGSFCLQKIYYKKYNSLSTVQKLYPLPQACLGVGNKSADIFGRHVV